MRLGFNTIKKADFLDAYPKAHMEAFKAQNIQSGFAATGIAPFQPDQVIQQNPRQLHKQRNKVKNLVGQGIGSPPGGLVKGLDQIIKACEYGIVNTTIMKKQYQDIVAANEKEKQKRKRSTRRIQQEGGLTREEVQDLVISPAESVGLSVLQPLEPLPAESRPRI
ncbi:hypothetical protein PABG_12605 [Paracoccidioides brasiliensis Pb03]|nr:hypothetical protein PABG_12605 [Paracoccidioides brasiliensis Pb03]